MAANGLAFVPVSMTPDINEHAPTSKNKRQWLTVIHAVYRLCHTSGQWMDVQSVGCGIDGEDKGVPKAMTGALKYAIRQAFLIPTGDDPENSGDQTSTAPAQQRPPDRSQPREAPRGREQRQGPSGGRQGSGSGTGCPACGGPCWDNEPQKGEHPNWPWAKCKDKACGTAIWGESEARAALGKPSKGGGHDGGSGFAAGADGDLDNYNRDDLPPFAPHDDEQPF